MTFDIKKRRKELGLTLEQVGKYTKVSKSTVSKWEKGTIKNMGAEKAKLLAQILKVDIAVLLEYEDIESAQSVQNSIKDTTVQPKQNSASESEHFLKAILSSSDAGSVRTTNRSTPSLYNSSGGTLRERSYQHMIIYEKDGQTQHALFTDENYESIIKIIEALQIKPE